MLWTFLILFIVVLDQVTKYLVNKYIEFGSGISIIEGFFYLVHWRNKGAAWGIFQNGRYFFMAITVVAIIVMLHLIYKSKDTFFKLSISLVMGGALGNFIDRVRIGSVIDFLDFHFWNYHFPTFNVADSFIVVGTIMLIYYIIFRYNEEKKL